VQKRLYALGYTQVGTADGIAGAMFKTALTNFQKKNGCTPTGLAEEEGRTWKKLLGLA
jgi:peptidoglycan hydrolase-like protein with peptidoglycan-binding domain